MTGNTVPRGASSRVTILVALLGLLIFINYVDRGNLSTAAPLIKDQLHLTHTQAGILLSAFFWTYTPFQLVSGWLAQRFNTYAVLTAGLVIWALATIATGLTSAFAVLLVLRLVLGIGESAAFPCASKLIAEQVPAERLGSANAILGIGLSLGPAFGIFAGGLLMASFGWRITFILFGALSLVWLVPWFLIQRGATSAAAAAPDRSPSWRAILSRRSAWGCGFGHFSVNYALYFLLAWLPLYLVKSRGFTVPQMAQIGGIVYFVQAASTVISGRIADRWIAGGMSANRARKTMMVAGLLSTAICMVAAPLGDARFAIIVLLLSGVTVGMTATNVYAAGQTCAGPTAAGKWIGFQNCIANLAGISAPALTGFLVDRNGDFIAAFAVAAGVSVFGAICWGLIIKRIECEDWGVAA
jgi:MFS family permease